MDQTLDQEELFLSRQEIKALKELVKQTHLQADKQDTPGEDVHSLDSLPVSRQELSQANRRFKLGLDMQEKDLPTLLYTAVVALEEIYGLTAKKTENLNHQFRILLDDLSQKLLERNKTCFTEEPSCARMRILERLV